MCQQFKNNSNYVSIDDYTIADDEDIAYELTVHDKRYEAVFYQKPLAIDSTKIAETRPISDGFRKNNVNYWAFREIRSIIPHL